MTRSKNKKLIQALQDARAMGIEFIQTGKQTLRKSIFVRKEYDTDGFYIGMSQVPFYDMITELKTKKLYDGKLN